MFVLFLFETEARCIIQKNPIGLPIISVPIYSSVIRLNNSTIAIIFVVSLTKHNIKEENQVIVNRRRTPIESSNKLLRLLSLQTIKIKEMHLQRSVVRLVPGARRNTALKCAPTFYKSGNYVLKWLCAS